MFADCLSPKYETLPQVGIPTRGRDHRGRWISHILEFWREAVIAALSILCIVLLFEHVQSPLGWRNYAVDEDYSLKLDDMRRVQFQWITDIYSTADPDKRDAVNAAWDEIVPAHGIVAVPHEWAAKRNLPASMSLFSDPSKGVYIIDAYHQIHCLTVIRKTFTQLSLGQAPSVPVGHSNHCFDSLLQYIVCGTSGDTLLYTWGRNITGDRQLRKCIDWNKRKTWAKENTACYKDSDHPVRLIDHFNHCENDDDGIRLPGW